MLPLLKAALSDSSSGSCTHNARVRASSSAARPGGKQLHKSRARVRAKLMTTGSVLFCASCICCITFISACKREAATVALSTRCWPTGNLLARPNNRWISDAAAWPASMDPSSSMREPVLPQLRASTSPSGQQRLSQSAKSRMIICEPASCRRTCRPRATACTCRATLECARCLPSSNALKAWSRMKTFVLPRTRLLTLMSNICMRRSTNACTLHPKSPGVGLMFLGGFVLCLKAQRCTTLYRAMKALNGIREGKPRCRMWTASSTPVNNNCSMTRVDVKVPGFFCVLGLTHLMKCGCAALILAIRLCKDCLKASVADFADFRFPCGPFALQSSHKAAKD
mmetsp:Transcript_112055/g.222725  ORF Transcript_112055/g.222725 Transcript_112055/m.222725 type:complete len:340 (-) Transcript_112055:1584-2603(-)